MEYTEEELLYTNNIGRKSFQWEMWPMCNNLCKFCYLGSENRHTNSERQLTSLNECIEAVKKLDFSKFNNISLIGGEFFQGQLDDEIVHDRFMELIRMICQLYVDKKIGSIWVTATLTLGDQKHLYEMLDIFESYDIRPRDEYGASGLWLCTSWDAEGRFHNEESRKNWEFHMKNVHMNYPWVKFNTTIILMKRFVEMYLSDEWVLKDFEKEFNTCLFFKQCGVGSYNLSDYDRYTDINEKWMHIKEDAIKRMGFEFFPDRGEFVRFLRKFAIVDPEAYDRLYNIFYRSDVLYRHLNEAERDTINTRFKGQMTESDAAEEALKNKCGHSMIYAPYKDSNKCCICDRADILETSGGRF